jgi:murein DD-endopeptidase MepM/ murein hydrolase activator NlpD
MADLDPAGPSGPAASDTANEATIDAAARAEAAQRVGRSGRDTATPAAPTASASPTASLSGPTPAASPSRTTSQPRPPAAWVHPMPGAEVTSCFGPRWGRLHAGIDLALPANTPVRSVGAGTVESAGWIQSGYGISVLIDHGNGYLTHYGHLNRATVAAGETVTAGELIGEEGSTGHSTGPHLHFEVHQGQWNQIDPAPWMQARGVDLDC